jgi:spermidine/putrescine transport system ATP-binding protein
VLDAVEKGFDGHRAVDRVSLSVRRGEFFSLLGPSGCGKSTLLRIVCGFETPDAGRVLLDGADVTLTPPHKRDVNLVFQNYALFPHLTVFENVAFGLRMCRVGDEDIGARVGHALDMVRLPSYGPRRPATLSGGEQQRVAIARALVTRPSVVLLDEPLGALDLKLRRGMQEELKRVQRESGVTFVYVTHDQEEALTMSDRIAVMSRGKVEQVGAPHEIYERPATRFAAEFIGTANLFEGTAEGGVVRTSDGLAIAIDGERRGDVTVVVRPEKLRFGSGKNAVDAVIGEILYTGPTSTVILQANGRKLVATASTNGLKCGDRIRVGWDPADAVIVT